MNSDLNQWRVIVVGGHTRSIGKTQLVCDLIQAWPAGEWIAGKITQYGHGICAQNGEHCACAPDEHICALSWETNRETGTDSARFLAAGARHSFWLRTKQGFLAEGMPLLREALREVTATDAGRARNLILESNTVMQYWKPAAYLLVVDPLKEDFKDSARLQLHRASALVLRNPLPAMAQGENRGATALSAPSLRGKPNFLQREGEPLPMGLLELLGRALDGARREVDASHGNLQAS